MKDPSDRFTAFATGSSGVVYIVWAIATTSVTVMVLSLIVAVGMLVTCASSVRKVRAARKPAVATRDPRQLASTAQDEAAKAADLGLPTGVWTDLAAAWTTWADTADAEKPVKAPETPAERPSPPKGRGPASPSRKPAQRELKELAAQIDALTPRKTGALAKSANGTAILNNGELVVPIKPSVPTPPMDVKAGCDKCGQVWEGDPREILAASADHPCTTTTPAFYTEQETDAVASAMRDLRTGAGDDYTTMKRVADLIADESAALPQVKATDPPTDCVYIAGENFFIDIPSAKGWQRTDLIVWHPESGFGRHILNVSPECTAADFGGKGQPIARVVMPPNTSTVSPSQITDLRSGKTVDIRNGSGEVIRRYQP